MAPAQGKWELAPGELVRAVGLEPTTHGLKVRAGRGVRAVPLTFTLPVSSVFPVLSPFPRSSVEGHLSALVRPSRPSRGGCRHGCRQIIRQQSVDLIGETIAVAIRLVAIQVQLPANSHQNRRRLWVISPLRVAVDCGLLLTQADLAASHLASGLEALMRAALAALSAEDLLGRA